MAGIDWGLLQIPDIGGNALAAFDKGRQTRRAEDGRNALAALAQNPDDEAAFGQLAQSDPETALGWRKQQNQQAQQLTEQQAAAAKQRVELIGQVAQWADTPEKWDVGVDYLAQQFPDVAQYKGKFSPETRMAAIASAGELKAHLERQQPVTVGPGSHLVDPVTGKAKFSAPFAPRPVTVGEGQTVVEYAPGVQPGQTGLSVDTFLPAIVAQESGGNYTARNASSGALGAYQVMPQTGASLAQRLGLPWQPQLMVSDTPEARQYQDAIGQAAIKEAIDNSGGDPMQAAMYYHGGSDRSKWGPKTQQYAQEVAARLGGPNGPRIIAQGPPKQDKPKDAPAGYRWKADGTQEPIPGGPADKPKAGKEDPAYSQSAMDAFDRAIGSADRLMKHRGLNAAVGVPSINPFDGNLAGYIVPGSPAADFRAELEAMKAQVFLPMVQSMKGMGALSNAEGEKLTASIGALDPKMSEGAFKASLKRIINDLNTYKRRAAAPQQPAGKPAAKPAGRPTVTNW